jgi:hypothetical protein
MEHINEQVETMADALPRRLRIKGNHWLKDRAGSEARVLRREGNYFVVTFETPGSGFTDDQSGESRCLRVHRLDVETMPCQAKNESPES